MDEFSVFRAIAQAFQLPPPPEAPTVITFHAVLTQQRWPTLIQLFGSLGLIAVAVWQSWLLRQSNETAKKQNEILIHQLLEERTTNEKTLREISQQTRTLIEQNLALQEQLKIERARVMPTLVAIKKDNSPQHVFLLNKSPHPLEIVRAGVFEGNREDIARSGYPNESVPLAIGISLQATQNPVTKIITIQPNGQITLYADGNNIQPLESLIGKDGLLLVVESVYPHVGVVRLVCPVSVSNNPASQLILNITDAPRVLDPITPLAPST